MSKSKTNSKEPQLQDVEGQSARKPRCIMTMDPVVSTGHTYSIEISMDEQLWGCKLLGILNSMMQIPVVLFYPVHIEHHLPVYPSRTHHVPVHSLYSVPLGLEHSWNHTVLVFKQRSLHHCPKPQEKGCWQYNPSTKGCKLLPFCKMVRDVSLVTEEKTKKSY